MPILDPSLQFSLLNEYQNVGKDIHHQDGLRFFVNRLRTASHYITQNINTIEAYDQFKKDIIDFLPLLNDKYDCKITKNDLESTLIKNYYKFIYDKLNPPSDEKITMAQQGSYYIFADIFQTKFFQPNIYDNQSHAWFISENPIAILCIRNDIPDNYSFLSILLEIDLMAASGYTLVLCVSNNLNVRQYIYDIIIKNQFSEIHINCPNSSLVFFEFNNDLIFNCKSYFYFYSNFNKQNTDKKLKINDCPRVKLIYFASNDLSCLKNEDFRFISTKPFKYCQNGFHSNLIPIRLSNIPLFETENESTSSIPIKASGRGIGYISQDDFLNWKNFRVKILFDDRTNKNHHTDFYINFKDLHKIRVSLYVKDQLALAKTDTETMNKVIEIDKNIRKKMNENKGEEFIKEKISAFLKEKKIIETLQYVAYAYSYTKTNDEYKFFAYKTQIYTAYEACKKFIIRKKDKTNKGIVFQVETGEGKTCIVCLIAAALALLKKTVHITSSNIKLSIRDFEESYRFFQLLGIQSAVLVHSYELPTKIRKKFKHDRKSEKKSATEDENNFKVDANYTNNNANNDDNGKFIIEDDNDNNNLNDSKIKVANDDNENLINDNKNFIIDNDNNNDNYLNNIDDNNNFKVDDNNNNNNLNNDDVANNFEVDNDNDNKNINNDDDDDVNNFEVDDANNNLNKDDDKNNFEVDSNYCLNNDDDVNNFEVDSDSILYNDDDDMDAVYNQMPKENYTFFGTNANRYYNKYSKVDENSSSKCYAEEFYGSKIFRNSSRMNYSVCGINDQGEESENKAQVIFSTFFNFECFYLKMVELCPGSVQKYFNEYCLLIDEADSILIDEIANGTIMSRSMKSNAIDILKYVYDQYDKKSYEETWQGIQDEKKWAICHNLITKEHVKQMYEEIKMIHEPGYEDGKKYSIVEFDVKKKKKMNRIIKRTLNFAQNVLVDFAKGIFEEFSKDPEAEDDDEDEDDDDEDDDDDDDDDDEGDDISDGNRYVTFRRIVPFSYDRNGILEKSKEFSGFVQQFIAIKESAKHENMVINDISMSYLYISHPIFVKLYGAVCGFTGTVGNQYDKKIFEEKYSLATLKVPRFHPNFRIQFPMILCKNKTERNQRIISEVFEFHRRGNPVLVIFQDLNEIKEVEYILTIKGIKYINVFNGKDETIRPDSIAGAKGAISLGTNVCGRGTNIRAKGPPLHVIVSYFSSNTRVMNQAFGRTARQGSSGSCRVICLESQFFQPIDILKDTGMLLNEFSIKNKRQQEFVDHFEKNRPWIFSGFPQRQHISSSDLRELREVQINVNRIIASNFVFPICMTKDLFLKIQAQRIFSLFNCPNSEFTWRLFQRYLREFILETWSLMINEIDVQFRNKQKGAEYDDELGKQMKILFKTFDNEYLPNRKEGIIPTFVFLFNKIRKDYEDDILSSFSKTASPMVRFNSWSFFSCKAGFIPFALLSESGARISSKNFSETNFIKDPELIYMKKTVKKKYTLFSITEKIDDLFNKILMKVNEILGSKTFLKLFLRRTIAGCEFGFCLNLDIENKDKDPFCIIDRDPLLVFTIFVRSFIPILAIILISVLLYLTSLAKNISKWFYLPSAGAVILKKTASIFLNALESNLANEIYDGIISFLDKNLNSNIEKLRELHEDENADIIEKLKNLFNSSNIKDMTSKISNHLGDKFDIKSKIGSIGENMLKPVPIMRICAYIVLLIASFIMNWQKSRQKIENYSESKEYDDNPNEVVLNDIMGRHQDIQEQVVDADVSLASSEEEFMKSHKEKSKTYLYKMAFCDLIQKFIDLPSFKIDKLELISKGVTTIARGIYYNMNNVIRISYPRNKMVFNQQVLFYATNIFSSIIKFIGFYKNRNEQHIYIEDKGNGTLKSLLNQQNNKISITSKLIIAYGIACAMNYLHNHLIIHRYLKPSNIFIDKNLYPYLYNFQRAKQIETPFPYHLKAMTLKYSPPEFIDDYITHQNSFHLDVYSYGMLLYYLITGLEPFHSFNEGKEKLIENIKNGKRPEFPENFPNELNEWKKLICKCWDEVPYKRPIFKNIISILESEFVNSKIIDIELFNNYKKNVLKIEDPILTVDQ